MEAGTRRKGGQGGVTVHGACMDEGGDQEGEGEGGQGGVTGPLVDKR